MNQPVGKTYRECECGRLTSLPFFCRACWTAMGHERQVAYYRAVQRHTMPRPGVFR